MSTQHYELQPGTVLDGRYRIEKKIGEGGFGITYLGVGLHQNEKVAIKEFFWKNYMERKLLGTSEVFLSREEDRKDYEHQKKRFLREARILREFAGGTGDRSGSGTILRKTARLISCWISSKAIR